MEAISPARRVIFISHATPEDNDFTLWLGSRLSAAGYEVWSDLTKLFGGEYFWQDIEKVIQEKAAKVIVVTTKATKSKKGLMDEIQVAINAESTLDDKEFVIPVVYKEFDFKKDSPIQINRKNATVFKDWANGLSQLIKKLETDNVPRTSEPSNSLVAWRAAYTKTAEIVQSKPELLQSNWYALSLPQTISFFEIGGIRSCSELIPLAATLQCPAREYLRLLVGFGAVEDYNRELSQPLNVTNRGSECTETFLGGTGEEVPCPSREAKKIVASLIRKGWDNFAKSKRLHPYQQADGQLVWWFPQDLTKDEFINFLKLDNSKGRRQLSGKYLKYHWHFGLKGTPILDSPLRMVFSAHVIFTMDGKTPIDTQYMHSKRRRGCKSWRNDKWRELFSASMKFLAGDSKHLIIPLGSDNSALIAADPIYMECPLSINVEELQTDPNTDVEIYEHEEDEDLEPPDSSGNSENKNPAEETAIEDNQEKRKYAT